MPGTVYALAVAPNGDLVVGGQFGRAGTVPVNNIARWNGATWSALGGGSGGVNGLVLALAFLPNGDLVAAGQFATAGGVVVNNVARWNGATWAPLGNGLNNPSDALATLPDGSVVADMFGIAHPACAVSAPASAMMLFTSVVIRPSDVAPTVNRWICSRAPAISVSRRSSIHFTGWPTRRAVAAISTA